MDTLSYKTISANKETADKKWLIVNAENELNKQIKSLDKIKKNDKDLRKHITDNIGEL